MTGLPTAVTITPEQAAQLTALCEEVYSERHEPPEKRWRAIQYCKALGERIIGYGPTAVAAVLEVHKIVRTENSRLGY